MSRSDDIAEIKSRLKLSDMVGRYTELRHAGNRLVAPCPFHQETKPSFYIDDDNGTFHCFGCQASGDLFDFYGRINGLDFKETLEVLAEEAGVTLSNDYGSNVTRGQNRIKKTAMFKMHELAAARFQEFLRRSPEGQQYLRERGIPQDLADAFSLGLSPGGWRTLTNILAGAGFDLKDAEECGLVLKNKEGRYFDRFRNRLMFPIRDVSGRVIAFGGRVIPALDADGAKYLNSSVTPIYKKSQQLFGLDKARRAVTVNKSIMITEGYMDVLTLHQFGYVNSVAVLGTSFPDEQVKRITELAKHVELLFDGDSPGREAAFKACGKLLALGIDCSVVLFPEKDDIDSLLRGKGKDVFEDLRRNAAEGLDFCIETLLRRSVKDQVEWARDFLKRIDMAELYGPYAARLASGLHLDEGSLRNEVWEQKKTLAVPQKLDEYSSVTTLSFEGSMKDRTILVFAVRYPDALDELIDNNADILISSSEGRVLWDKLTAFAGDDLLRRLDQAEKNFWFTERDGQGAAPINEANRINEFEAVMNFITLQHTKQASEAVRSAMLFSKEDYPALRTYISAFSKKGDTDDEQHQR